MRARKSARHYTGRHSDINGGRGRYYGTREPCGGPGSGNSSGRPKHGEAAAAEARKAEVEEARRIVDRIRRKKERRYRAKGEVR